MGSQDFHLSLHCRLTADSTSQGKGESCESQSLWKQWQGGAGMHIGFLPECYLSQTEKQILGSHGVEGALKDYSFQPLG